MKRRRPRSRKPGALHFDGRAAAAQIGAAGGSSVQRGNGSTQHGFHSLSPEFESPHGPISEQKMAHGAATVNPVHAQLTDAG